MPPVSLYGRCDVIARHGNGLSDGQTGDTDQHIVFIVLNSFYLDIGYFVFLGSAVIKDSRIVNRIIYFLCGNLGR